MSIDRKSVNPFAIFYTYRADIYRYEDIKDGAISKKTKKLLYSKVPCRYSRNSGALASSEVAKIETANTIFFDVNTDIKEGDYIEVYSDSFNNKVCLNIGEIMFYTYQVECKVKRSENV